MTERSAKEHWGDRNALLIVQMVTCWRYILKLKEGLSHRCYVLLNVIYIAIKSSLNKRHIPCTSRFTAGLLSRAEGQKHHKYHW